MAAKIFLYLRDMGTLILVSEHFVYGTNAPYIYWFSLNVWNFSVSPGELFRYHCSSCSFFTSSPAPIAYVILCILNITTFLLAIPFLVSCLACLRNFLNLLCELSCSPNQSLLSRWLLFPRLRIPTYPSWSQLLRGLGVVILLCPSSCNILCSIRVWCC